MTENCHLCRFFREGLTSVSLLTDQTTGECRKQPPRFEQRGACEYGWRIWPAVYGDDWCGSFEPDRSWAENQERTTSERNNTHA